MDSGHRRRKCFRSSLASVSQLGSAGNMHDVTRDEAGLLGQQKNAGISDHVALGAVAQGMNRIKVFGDSAGVRLVFSPLTQHWRPSAGWTDGVHTDPRGGVV